MNVLFLGMACLLTSAACYWIRGHGSARPAGTWAMGALLALFALAFVSYAPLFQNAVEAVVPHVAQLLSNCASVAAATAVLAVSFQVNLEPAEARRRVRARLVLLTAWVLGMAVLFTCEQMAHRSPRWYALYVLLFIAYLTFAVVDFLRQTFRQSKSTRRSSVRNGLRAAAVGCVFALVYAAYKVAVLISLGLGFRLVPDHARCSSLVSFPCVFSVTSPALAVLLICLGITLPAVAYPISQARLHRWEIRSYAALGPLWADLTAATPQIVLPGADLGDDAVNDSGFLLQRRVVEISDGILALRPYRSRKVQEAVQVAVGIATESGAAGVEAAVVKAALASLRSGRRPAEVAELPAPNTSFRGGDLRAETQWLVKVADAYAQDGPPLWMTADGRNRLEPDSVIDSTQDPHVQEDPCAAFEAMRPSGLVQPVSVGSAGHSSYLVLGYAEARQALGDPRLSKDTAAFFADKGSRRRLHPAVAHTMLASDPPQHTRLRKLVAKAFTTGAIAALRPFVVQSTDALLDRWPVGGQVDVVTDLAVPLPVMVICELLGVPEADRSDVRRWSAELFAAGRPDRIDAASHAVAEYMTDLIAARRQRPEDALLDHLIALRDGQDQLSEDELVSLAVLLLVAGHETTTNFIGNALLALLQHPAELVRLRENPGQVSASLDELLRYGSPVSTATFRYTTEAVTLGGTEIPAGVPVVVALGAANRDPERFPSPEQLDLSRDAAGHLGFGHGIHRCIGAPLARLEADTALRAILARFPDIRLAVPPDQLAWRRTRLVRGLTSLPVLT